MGGSGSADLPRQRAGSPPPLIHAYRDPSRPDELKSNEQLDQAFLVVNTAHGVLVCLRCKACVCPAGADAHVSRSHPPCLPQRSRGPRDPDPLAAAVKQVFADAGIALPDSNKPPDHLLQHALVPPNAVQPFPVWAGFLCTTCLNCYRTVKAFQGHMKTARGQDSGSHPARYEECMEEAYLQRFSKTPGQRSFIPVRAAYATSFAACHQQTHSQHTTCFFLIGR